MTEELPKNYYDSTAKEESKEEVNQSRYFDAENTEDGIPSPLASSSKKKKLRKLKKDSCSRTKAKADAHQPSSVLSSSESELSDLNMSSISSTSINTTCSPEQLRKKAEKRVLKVKKALKMKLKEEALKTLKYDTKRIKNKIGVYGEADDESLNFLEDKLEDLIMQIDQQIEERRIVDRKLRQLPRGEMMTWD